MVDPVFCYSVNYSIQKKNTNTDILARSWILAISGY